MSPRIPTLDIRRFETDREAFVAELGAAYREWGFAGIKGHGIAQSSIDAAYEAFKAFFALPEETKMKYHVPGSGGARGYTPFGVETAKGSKHFDLKEFWHIGREVPVDFEHPLTVPDIRAVVGSSQRLVAELISVSPALGMQIDSDGRIAAASLDSLVDNPDSVPLGGARECWAQLYDSARVSVSSGLPLIFQ